MERRSSSRCLFVVVCAVVVVAACSSQSDQHGATGSAGQNGNTGGAAGTASPTGAGGTAGTTPTGSGGSAAGATPTAGNGGAAGDGGAAGGAIAGQSGGSDAAAGATTTVDGAAGALPGTSDPGTDGDGVFPIAAPFTAAPEMSDQPNIPKGMIIQFTMANTTTFADGARKVAVYIPANYVSGTEVPFMVAQDGVNPSNGGSFGLDDLRPLMDNMIAAKRIPMMAGVFVDPGAMRSVEYDTVSDKYYQFVETELLPAAVAQAKMKNVTLTFTKDPLGRGSFGGSSGGAAAFTMGWFHPESYTRILTISGSFLKLQSSTMYPNGCGDYAMTLIPSTTPNLPLRVFLEAGDMDLGGTKWRTANDAMAAALKAKGYHYRYVTAAGAMHEDDGARRQYLPSAMEWLWRGYPIK
jgi:enterochelin esterase-like enzyme